jgi:eukaryotic-like serine/threonine-protein kinase
MAVDDVERDDLLDRLGEEFAARLRRGEQPSLKEYADGYPELADEIRELFPAMFQVERAKEICLDWDNADQAHATVTPLPPQVGDYRILREVGRGGMGLVYEAEQVSLARRVALKVLPWQVAKDRTTLARFRREARASARLHHTNIVPVFEVGQDGQFSYYAMQFIQGQSLDSVIDELRRLRGQSPALRVLGPAAAGPSNDRRLDSGARDVAAELGVAQSLLTGQFQREPVVGHAAERIPEGDNGPVASEPVLPTAPDTSAVMPGGAQLTTVESRCRTFHRGVAHIGRQVASALAYAHARGIVHRDIKPSNLLLDTEGVAWVSDFGLAKVDDEDLTRTGDIMGTLRYMAPERFRGRGDARADVYSLGLTLYELLVLRPAFDSADRVALSEQIKDVEPPRPRSIDPRVPRDLETIVLKAIEKDPRARYASADALAEDLRRFLDDEPIRARRVGAPEQFIRWARRHRAVAVLGGLLTAVLFGATIAAGVVAGRMAALAKVNERSAENESGAKLIAQAARAQAELQRERAEQHLYVARIGQAEGALRLFDSASARTLLDQCRPTPGSSDHRGWEWFYLDQWCRPELKTISLPITSTSSQPTNGITSHCVAVSPDGSLLAVGCAEPFAMNADDYSVVPTYLISLPDGKVLHELGGPAHFVFALTFRPDGKRLATLGADGTIRTWDTDSGRELKAMRLGTRSGHELGGLSWSPDGRHLVSAVGDGLVRILDADTATEIVSYSHNARTVAWSPDGAKLASGGEAELEVRPWNAGEGRPMEPVLRRAGLIHSLTWSPDGRRLAVVSFDDNSGSPGWGLNVWDTTSGERVFRENHVTQLWSVAFSPNGAWLATGGKDGIVRVFDAGAGREHAALFTGSTNVSGLAFSPDGHRLYAAGWGMDGVKVFDPARDPRGRSVRGFPEQTAALTFDKEGLRILGASWTGGELASADPVDGTVQVDRLLAVSDSRRWPRGDFAFSADGTRLAAPTRRDRTEVGVLDLALGRRVATLRGSGGEIMAVAFRADGQSVATAAVGGAKGQPLVTVWDLASGRAIRTFDAGPHPVEVLAFSNDGQKLAAGGGTKQISLGWVTAWSTETGATLGTLDRVGLVKCLAFHPDGARLAIADMGGNKYHLWNIELGSLISNSAPTAASCVAFAPDGNRLVAMGYDGTVHLADARTGDEVLVLRGVGPPIGSLGFTPRIAFSPDGSRIAANFVNSGLLNLWDLGPMSGLAVEPKAGDLAGWLRQSRGLADQGDIASAEAAYARACELDRGDPSPWIEHAFSLWRRGDSSRARDAWSRAVSSIPDDPARWIDLGRQLARVGRTRESETALAKARTIAERRLSGDPDDEAAAAALAELLPDGERSSEWTILQSDAMTSAAGATLTRMPDGSIMASGTNASVDTYIVEATSRLSGITGLRLEALTDSRLPHHGPGRHPDDGNFILRAIRLSTVQPPAPVRLAKVRADYSFAREGFVGVCGTIDADPNTAWSIAPLAGHQHWATFQVDQPIGREPGLRLRIELEFGQSRFPRHALGRFRLSVTNRPCPLFDASLLRIKADAERNGLMRLGAAYSSLGDWTSAAAVLGQAAARPDAPALDGLLLALVHYHVGRRDESRSLLEQALQRLTTERGEDDTRDVAVAALMTIRGLSVGEAELLLLDLAFPSDPLAP